jgi:hypothetical protein
MTATGACVAKLQRVNVPLGNLVSVVLEHGRTAGELVNRVDLEREQLKVLRKPALSPGWARCGLRRPDVVPAVRGVAWCCRMIAAFRFLWNLFIEEDASRLEKEFGCIRGGTVDEYWAWCRTHSRPMVELPWRLRMFVRRTAVVSAHDGHGGVTPGVKKFPNLVPVRKIVYVVNKWISQLPRAWTGCWKRLRLKPTRFENKAAYRDEVLTHLRRARVPQS